LADINEEKSQTKDSKYYLDKLEGAYNREQVWLNKARDYHRRYINSRDSGRLPVQTVGINQHGRYNIFYSNTEVLKSAILPNIPSLLIEKRFATGQLPDEVRKRFFSTVSDVMQKAVAYNVEGESVRKEIDRFKYDYLITGRGVLWCSFTADVKGDKPKGERVVIEHVNFDDFRMTPCKRWSEVWWVARRRTYTKDSLTKRFGDKAKDVEFTYKERDLLENSPNVDIENQAEVWEIWDKETKKVHFVTTGYEEEFLDTKDDPYGLDGFFPTPEPLRSIPSNLDLVPVPELDLYIRECEDLAVCSLRIARLIRSIRARAFYPAQFGDIMAGLNKANDSEYIGVDLTPEINEFKGMENIIYYDPIEVKQKVSTGLYQQQKNLIDNIYEITGISDVMRNAPHPNETATATIQKSKFGTLRIQGRQDALNGYIKEIYGITSEIISSLSTAETLSEITGLDLPFEDEIAPMQRSAEKLMAYIDELEAAEAQAKMEGKAAEKQQPGMPGQQQQPPMPGMPPGMPSGMPPDPQKQAMMQAKAINPKMAMQNIQNQKLQQKQQEMLTPFADKFEAQAMGLSDDPVTSLQRIIAKIQQPTWESVSDFLRNNKLRGYVLKVETDFDLWQDQKDVQQSRTEMLNVVSQSMQQMAPVVGASVENAEIYYTLLTSLVDVFHLPSVQKNKLEDLFSQIVEKIKKNLQEAAQKPPQPEPTLILAQAEMAKAQAEIQSVQQKGMAIQMDMNLEQMKMQADQQQAQVDMQIRQMELEVKKQELQIEAQKAQVDVQTRQGDLGLKGQKITGDLQAKFRDLDIKQQKVHNESRKLIHEKQKSRRSDFINAASGLIKTEPKGTGTQGV